MWKVKARRFGRLAVAIGLGAVFTAGCFAVTDLDRFKPASGTLPDGSSALKYSDFRFHLVQMSPHEGHTFEYRIVNNSNNIVLFRGIIDSISSGDTDLFAPFSIAREGGPYRLDFYADTNGSGRVGGRIDPTKAYDGTPNSLTKDGGTTKDSDHAWRRDPIESSPEYTPSDRLVEIKFVHDTQFTDINTYPSGTLKPAQDTGVPVTIRLENNTHTGSVTNVNIFNQASGQLNCQYRFRYSETSTLLGTVPGCVEAVTNYRVEVFIDTNTNYKYDDPTKEGGDLGFVSVIESGRDALEVVLDVGEAEKGKNPVSEPW